MNIFGYMLIAWLVLFSVLIFVCAMGSTMASSEKWRGRCDVAFWVIGWTLLLLELAMWAWRSVRGGQ